MLVSGNSNVLCINNCGNIYNELLAQRYMGIRSGGLKICLAYGLIGQQVFSVDALGFLMEILLIFAMLSMEHL